MDHTVLNECKNGSLAGTMTFPEVIMKMAATGVERYRADLVGKRFDYYGVNDEVYSSDLPLDLARVALRFDAAAIKSAVVDSQQKAIDYKTFLNRSVSAGCSHYEVFIMAKKVIYFGRDGSQHIEYFPQAK